MFIVLLISQCSTKQNTPYIAHMNSELSETDCYQQMSRLWLIFGIELQLYT